MKKSLLLGTFLLGSLTFSYGQTNPILLEQSSIEGKVYSGTGFLNLKPMANNRAGLQIMYLDRFGPNGAPDGKSDLFFQLIPTAYTGETGPMSVFESYTGSGLFITTGAGPSPIIFGIDRAEQMRLHGNGNLGLGTSTPSNVRERKKKPLLNRSHLFLGSPTAVSGTASSLMTFAGTGIQHAGFAWVPNTDLSQGKLHLAFGGSDDASTNSTKVTFQSNGNVGIGTMSPESKFHLIDGTGTLRTMDNGDGMVLSSFSNTKSIGLSVSDNGNYGGAGSVGLKLNGGDILFYSNGTLKTVFKNNGQVGIGTSDPGTYHLAVNGDVKAKKVNITLEGWSDFVFEEEYVLRPLIEVEQFIKTHKHLPEVPSEAEVLEKGVELGEMNATLLQKIEELTLYAIQQEGVLKKQAQKLEEQEQELKEKEAMMQQFMQRLERVESNLKDRE